MKKIEVNDMIAVQGGEMQSYLCGAAVGFAIFATGGWAVFGACAAMALCLSGDSSSVG